MTDPSPFSPPPPPAPPPATAAATATALQSSSSKRTRYNCPYCRERFFTVEFRDTHANSWCKKRPLEQKNDSEINQLQSDEEKNKIHYEKVIHNLNVMLQRTPQKESKHDSSQDQKEDPIEEMEDKKAKYLCEYCSDGFFSSQYRDRHMAKCSQRGNQQKTPTPKSTKKSKTPNSNDLRDLAISLTKQLLSVHATPAKDKNIIYTCPDPSCQKRQFKSENALKNHMKDAHRSQFASSVQTTPGMMAIIPSPIDPQSASIYQCNLPNCSVNFRSKSNFFNHLRLTHKLSEITEEMIPQYMVGAPLNHTLEPQPPIYSNGYTTPYKLQQEPTMSYQSSNSTFLSSPYYSVILKCAVGNCQKSFSSKLSLLNHLKDAHQTILPRDWIMEPIVSSSSSSISSPMRNNSSYRCLWCELYFSTEQQREIHCNACPSRPSPDTVLRLLLATLDGVGGTASVESTPLKSLDGVDPTTLSEELQQKIKLKEKRKSLRKSITPADEALLLLSKTSTFPNTSSTAADILATNNPPRSNSPVGSKSVLSPVLNPHDNEVSEEDSDTEWDDDFSDQESTLPKLLPFHAIESNQTKSLSLKEIHRNALLEAYLSLAEVPEPSNAQNLPNGEDMDISDSHLEALETCSLSFDKFVSWDQISSVISQGGLTEEIVRNNFHDILSSRTKETNSTQQVEENHANGIFFDEFCILMERLEYASTGEEEILKDVSHLSAENENHAITPNIDQPLNHSHESNEDLSNENDSQGVDDNRKA